MLLQKDSMYRGRFAPSPTGYLHLGTARTALWAWLRARAHDGVLVLRVEDLDSPRCQPDAAAAIVEDLRWLGLDWDEGPSEEKLCGPYVQSERLTYYETALQQLRASGLLYPCSCTRRELKTLASAPHGQEEFGSIYPGWCRAAPCKPNTPYALRFVMPDPEPSFVDGRHGYVSTEIWRGDCVVQRADGVVAYQLAVAVDDALMGITEVVRGEDLLTSTPRQIALQSALGFRSPSYFHVPLMLDEDGRRLSKRERPTSLRQLRQSGWTAEQCVGHLAASLGWCSAQTTISARELLQHSSKPWL